MRSLLRGRVTATPGVNVVGQFRSESGVGEAARAVVAGLDAAGIPVLPVLPLDASPSRQGVAFPVVSLAQATFPLTLSLLPAFETPPFLAAAPARFLRGRRFVGLWWWELDAFPDFMAEAFTQVDAVWAGTHHVQAALARAAQGTPVELIRYAVRRPVPTGATREALGLPGGVLFTTVFGYYSSVARKNPAGVIEAFQRAFPIAEPGGPQLVVKAIDEAAHPEEHAAIMALVAPRPDIHLLPGYLDRAAMDDLLALSDVVVSLHRAEGLGYTPAEAMALGTAVIATRYSGNLEYMTDANALLIDAPMITIGADGGPYAADAQWADPDLDQAAAAMRRLAGDPALRDALGQRAAADLAAQFSVQAAGESMRAALARLAPARARPNPLTLMSARRRAARLRAAR